MIVFIFDLRQFSINPNHPFKLAVLILIILLAPHALALICDQPIVNPHDFTSYEITMRS